MGYTQKLGLLAQSVFQDSSLNVGIGAAPSGTYKLEVTGTAKVSSTLLVSGAATFSSSASIGGYLTGQGTNPGGLGGSRYVLDWLGGSMRIFSYGADASTNGGFIFNSQRSNGTNDINVMIITSTGVSVTGTLSTNDLGLSNMSSEPNIVDKTQGSWLIQEGKDDLYIINQLSGKKYKFNLTEI